MDDGDLAATLLRNHFTAAAALVAIVTAVIWVVSIREELHSRARGHDGWNRAAPHLDENDL